MYASLSYRSPLRRTSNAMIARPSRESGSKIQNHNNAGEQAEDSEQHRQCEVPDAEGDDDAILVDCYRCQRCFNEQTFYAVFSR